MNRAVNPLKVQIVCCIIIYNCNDNIDLFTVDIKPENLLLTAYDCLKISDFGMATIFRHQVWNDEFFFINI